MVIPAGRVGVMVLCLVAVNSGCAGGDDARAVPDRSRAGTLVVGGPVDHFDVVAREPMIVEHPDGILFVSGYGSGTPALWKSADHGAAWSRVNVGTEADGAVGNSDVDLAVARDGTLYFVTMTFDRTKGEGTHISIGVSTDVGATWRWTLLSKTRFDDRPWVEVAPDGTAHVIWNDGGGVSHAVSNDGGKTWTEWPRIHTQGGSSHLAVGPNSELAVRITPLSASGNKIHEGVDLIAVSTDAGATWQKYPAPGRREWVFPLTATQKLPRWVEPIAWDDRGALYSLWSNDAGLWLARSGDRGARWTSWRVIESSDAMYFPYLVARGDGELAATWFSGPSADLRAHVARFDAGPGDAPPRVIAAPPFRPDSWVRGQPADASDPPRDPAGEYLSVMFLRDGALAVVSPIQNERARRFGFSWWRITVR